MFGGAITAPREIFTDVDVTVNAIQFSNANTYTVAGSGSTTLFRDTGDARIVVTEGNHEFQAVVNLNTDTGANIVQGASLEFNNAIDLGGHTLTKTGEADRVSSHIPTSALYAQCRNVRTDPSGLLLALAQPALD